MAGRRTTPRELQEAVRDAVERTVQATVGSAGRTRNRAQGAVDDLVGTVDELVRGAEAGLAKSRRAVTDALPATQEDVRALRTELRRIGRRLDAIEARLPSGTRGRRTSRSG
jgi:polyhydroxyalkanoate synthesis regulator phasin